MDVLEPSENELKIKYVSVLKTVSCELGKAEARLHKLEGAISLDKAKGEDDVAWMFDEEVGIGSRVHRLLRDHVAFWEQT